MGGGIAGVTSFNGAAGAVTGVSTVNGAGAGPVTTTVGPGLQQTTVANNTNTNQLVEAEWTMGITRIYAVDFVSGNDANAGFADPATSSAADYAIACAAAGAVAKKTLAGLGAIFPRLGAGRTVEVVIANGGAGGVAQAYAGDMNVAIGGSQGYAVSPVVRATGTNTTAGCTKFDGSAADCIYLGAMTATGMNAAGYNPVAAFSTTVIKSLKVGGAAPAFAAEAAAAMPLGARIRFDAATTTAALRNIARPVVKVAGTDTITVPVVLPAVPVGTDVFYIEMPAVTVDAITMNDTTAVPSTGIASNSVTSFAGLAAGTIAVVAGRFVFAFCWTTTTFLATDGLCNISPSYTHTVRGSQTVGGSRSGSSCALTSTSSTLNALHTVTSLTVSVPSVLTILDGVTIGTGLNAVRWYVRSDTPAIGRVAAFAAVPVRILAGGFGIFGGGSFSCGQLESNNPTGNAVFVEGGPVFWDMSISGANTSLTGAGGIGFGLNVQSVTVTQNARNCAFRIGTVLPAFTGSLADVGIAGGTVTWAQVGATGIVDLNGNRFYNATNASPLGIIGKFSGVLVTDAVLTSATFLGDPGFQPLLNANGTPDAEYPTSLRFISRMRVFAPTGNGATPFVVTLFKRPSGGANAATTQTVTVPALAAVGSNFSDLIHPILYADGDTFSVKVTSAATAEGNKPMTVTLQGPSC